MKSLNPITISLDAREPKDINESLTMMCLYLDLNKSTEESKCFLSKAGRVDYSILLRFCERNDLLFHLDFKTMVLEITFTPVVDDITQEIKLIEEERALKEIQASKEAEKIAASKRKSSFKKGSKLSPDKHKVDQRDLAKELGLDSSKEEEDDDEFDEL